MSQRQTQLRENSTGTGRLAPSNKAKSKSVPDPANSNLKTAVLGPLGKPITLEDLPPPGIKRWVVRRKAEVVAGVNGGLISLSEACRLYDLSEDEFRSWQRLLDDHGLAGLRTTNLKKYRKRASRARSRDDSSPG